MKRAKNSLFRGFCVFSENGFLCCNDLRSKEFNGINRKKHCRLRHFRDSEKRLPCGIRTVALRLNHALSAVVENFPQFCFEFFLQGNWLKKSDIPFLGEKKRKEDFFGDCRDFDRAVIMDDLSAV